MSTRDLPPLAPLQFLVLGPLLAPEQPDRALRRTLAQCGIRRSAPAVDQMRGRLEDAGWVDGSDTQKTVDSQIIRERRYRITTTGARAYRDTRDSHVEATRWVGRAAVAHV